MEEPKNLLPANPTAPVPEAEPTASVSVQPQVAERMPSPTPAEKAPTAGSSPFPVPWQGTATTGGLAGEPARISNRGLLGLADALLKAPANVAHELNTSDGAFLRVVLLVMGCMSMTGLVIASFSGGLQFLAVPLKLAFGTLIGAALCLPSLYIFSCLSEVKLPLRGVAAAQLMGLGVQGLLLTGFAPIAWVFSQSTNSPVFMGGLYLLFFAISVIFGLGLTARVLAQEGIRIRALWVWNIIFVVVLLQLSTSLRPLVGPFDGVFPQEKQFFLAHWVELLFRAG